MECKVSPSDGMLETCMVTKQKHVLKSQKAIFWRQSKRTLKMNRKNDRSMMLDTTVYFLNFQKSW